MRIDRPEIKHVSKAWVKDNCKTSLTDRDMDLLRLIHKKQLLRRDQIQALLPGAFPNEDRLQKRLLKLYQMHIIDRICPKVGIGEGSSQQHVCVDRAGAILLDIQEGFNKFIQGTEGNKWLPQRWRHVVAINDYEILIRDIVRDMGGEVLYYTVEREIKYAHTCVKPDILCLIRWEGKPSLFIVEVDLDTEDMKTLKNKVHNYKACYLSGAWRNTKWARAFKTDRPPFPKILFFTEDDRPKRVKTLKEYVKDTGSVKFQADHHCNAREIIVDTIMGSL
jgi:hypothetical protein